MSEQMSYACGSSDAFVGVVIPSSGLCGESSHVSGNSLVVDGSAHAASIALDPSVTKTKQELLALLEARLTGCATSLGLQAGEDVNYTRQQLSRVIGMPLHGVCGRVRSLLDKSALAVRGEAKCRSTGKYRELLGLPEVER